MLDDKLSLAGLAALGSISLTCIIGAVVITIYGYVVPDWLPTIAGTAVGAMAGFMQQKAQPLPIPSTPGTTTKTETASRALP